MTRQSRTASEGAAPEATTQSRAVDEQTDPARKHSVSATTLERLSAPGTLESPAGETTSGEVPTLDRIVDHLQTEEEIGHGAMSHVYRVFDPILLRTCAMKVLAPRLATDVRARLRFVNEAQITGQLDHPNIVPVHALGTHASGALYFTMKLVDGITLADKLLPHRERPRQPDWIAEYLEVFVKTCDAVAFAHSRGVLHRDIKPDNVIVGGFGEVYLMDWGVARLVEGPFSVRAAAHEDLDRDGMLIGTIDFMAPEQARGETSALDERTDIYSLGALLYYILSGRSPYEHVDRRVRLGAVQRGEAASLDAIATSASLPPRLRAIVARALAIDPAGRYATVIDMKNEIVQYARGMPTLPRKTFAKGDIIVREGERGEAAYLIREGTCEVYKALGGERKVLRRMGPGEVFGELSILSSKPVTATVEAVDDVTVDVVDAAILREGVGLNTWLGPFVTALVDRFRELDEKLTGRDSE
jgi:tRNA A-37 threonylcarbamoyl transferase component Bud32